MEKEDLKKNIDNFKNKSYDAQFDYWWSLVNLIFLVCCAVAALIFYVFG